MVATGIRRVDVQPGQSQGAAVRGSPVATRLDKLAGCRDKIRKSQAGQGTHGGKNRDSGDPFLYLRWLKEMDTSLDQGPHPVRLTDLSTKYLIPY